MDPQKIASPAAPVRPSPNEAGFSVIEGLIAALLLLVVTLGILPLFSRAMNNNVKGNDSTRQSNAGIGALETSISLPFNSADMDIPSGSTSVVVNDTLALKKVTSPSGGVDQVMSNRWELPADLATGDTPVLNRQRTVRQYSFDDFADNQILDRPLDGDVEPRIVHLKAVDLVLSDGSGDPLALNYRLRLIQAY
jgi:Tfp pilus assembly protein PilV